MRSGNHYENYFKLTSSLTQLVIAGNRNLEAINKTLQEIVFGKQEKLPTAKNWPVILELWGSRFNDRGNRHIALALAVLDMRLVAAGDPDALTLVRSFPECFADEEVRKPFPISFISMLAATEGIARFGSPFKRDWPDSAKQGVENSSSVGIDEHNNRRDGILEILGIPHSAIRTKKSEHPDMSIVLVTREEGRKFGETIHVGDKWYVVLQGAWDHDDDGKIHIALTEHIDTEDNYGGP